MLYLNRFATIMNSDKKIKLNDNQANTLPEFVKSQNV